MMQKPTSAVLLVGSPKGPNSTSNSLGTFLLDKLQEKGMATQKIYLCQNLGSEEKKANLLRLVDKSDLIILAFPLYVDCLHLHVIETLELIAETKKANSKKAKKALLQFQTAAFLRQSITVKLWKFAGYLQNK